ncbi:MAG: long-chain fatty acid--CoA ligase, partial [Propionibacteriaceae bacterium]|nr:long-chain fatty acid--CoA ligase [Propionibacteriaceae bacterium]
MIEPLIQRAVRHPDRTALVYQDQTLSYAELLEQVNRFARALSRLGVGAADRVGYVLENRLEIVAVFYAIQAIGAVAVPINIRSIAPEIACLSRAVGAKAVVYSKLRREQVAEAEKEMGRVELICVDPLPGGQDLPTLAEDESSAEFSGPRATTALSRIQFTGGSTGTPKGAMRTHQADLINIDGTAQACFLTGAEPKTVLIQCPLEHHGGHAWLTASIAFGATVVICGAFDPQRVLQAIERHRVTHAIMLPPTTYLRLMEYPDIDRYDLSSLRVLQTSAGAASKHFVAQVYRHFPNCLINYGWGQTESGLGSTLVLSRGLLAKDDPKLGS